MMEEDERGKLFVGGLSWETTQENLSRYFCRFGEIIDCVVMKNNETGRSRGFGFVTFADPANVNHVLQSGPHTLDGRTIDPKPCNPRTLQKPKKGGGYKVFLGGLPSNVTETDLRTFFGRYGKVTEVVIMYDQEKKKSRGFGFLSFEEEQAVEHVTNERYINLHGKQVEIKKAEPRDGSSGGNANNSSIGCGYGKMGNDAQWGGPHHGAPMNMMQGPNGQMGGPPLNMPIGAPNMMPSYQGWGTSPQQQGYGYGNSGPGSYQGWGAPPGPQGPPHHQWGNYGGPQQTQGYGGYDMYNSASTGGPNGPSAGATWNWPPTSAGGPAGAASGAGTGGSGSDMYSRAQTWGATGPSGPGPVGVGGPRTGPGNSTSKSGSEYDYGGYGSGYDYDYGTYSKDPAATGYGAGPRAGYGNDNSSQPPYPASQAV
ncbi:heterogeneous nuclear ribonucleoprotein 27C [Condylostylus longicornis]|uniref:heterogeneous nuclear ribonucleoprotein 27C n=1 Tax=Condylostylus longicornis TaxID=2530218 RepID=UPI00244DDDC3|nr:heterogeneous nuclear ribonucleoprotein 27C [Condylostylus longicornis]